MEIEALTKQYLEAESELKHLEEEKDQSILESLLSFKFLLFPQLKKVQQELEEEKLTRIEAERTAQDLLKQGENKKQEQEQRLNEFTKKKAKKKNSRSKNTKNST